MPLRSGGPRTDRPSLKAVLHYPDAAAHFLPLSLSELLRDGISLPHLSLIFNYVDTSVAIHKVSSSLGSWMPPWRCTLR